MLNITETKWRAFLVEPLVLPNAQPLFERIDPERIDEELRRLSEQSY